VNSPTMMIDGMTVAGKWADIFYLAQKFNDQKLVILYKII
jgi:hypothetical protein